jgi:hypothetical protein
MTPDCLPVQALGAARSNVPNATALPKRRFRRLRCLLLTHDVASLRFVYCSFAETLHVTLCAAPRQPGRAALSLPPAMTSALLRAFVHWMALTQPSWPKGADSVGSLDFNVDATTFVHRHSGYQLQLTRTTRSG